MMHQKQIETLARFVPVVAAEHVAGLISSNRMHLNISRARRSKLGDFRPARQGGLHRISVNANLNVYAFLLVFLHELAHLLVWEKHKNKVAPHGDQWKDQFGFLIREHLALGHFHPALHQLLEEMSQKPKAAGLGHEGLTRALALFDKESENAHGVFLEELPAESVFQASNGRMFRKEERLRKRYRCLCLETNKRYLFHPMAKVMKCETESYL
ncbi:MAG: hypothetical protein R6U64_05730 [Bacteroidales bacterium]